MRRNSGFRDKSRPNWRQVEKAKAKALARQKQKKKKLRQLAKVKKAEEARKKEHRKRVVKEAKANADRWFRCFKWAYDASAAGDDVYLAFNSWLRSEGMGMEPYGVP